MKSSGSLLGTCVLSAGIGIFVYLLFPAYALFSVLLIGIGVAGFLYDWLTRDRFDPLWKNLNLCKGGQYPRLIRQQETTKGKAYLFRVPAGLGTEDFERSKSAIVQFLGQDVEIERDGRYLRIREAGADPSVRKR